MSSVMWIAMGSIFIGFILFGSAFATFSYGKSQKLVWTLFGLSLIFMTLIPVIMALSVAI
ncbi:MAG: hypothetical protein Q3976_03930 [Corynebacterium sp.]|nr:hypothetical protein [Corynebacterium sp.]